MTDDEPAGKPTRVIALRGATNFRDLGGYAGHGGRPLRWRRLFRSDHLGGLAPEDHAVLSDLGVAAAFDFRGRDERAAAPYDVPGLDQHPLPIEPTVAQRMQEMQEAGQGLDGEAMAGLMRDLYRGLVLRQAPRFAQLFRHILAYEPPTGSIVFHCTAGKDRTGVAAALLLLALGVPRTTVMEDYLLTNKVFKPPWQPREDIDPDALRALWGVQPGYLEAAFEVIDKRFGGTERYLREQVGLDDERLGRLARRYLE